MNLYIAIPIAYVAAFIIVYLTVRGMEGLMAFYNGDEKSKIPKLDRFLIALWAPYPWFDHQDMFKKDNNLLHYALNEQQYNTDKASIRFALFHAAFGGVALLLGCVLRAIILVIVALTSGVRKRRWAKEAAAREAAEIKRAEERRLASRTYESRRETIQKSFDQLCELQENLEILGNTFEEGEASVEEQVVFKTAVKSTFDLVSWGERQFEIRLGQLDKEKKRLDERKKYCGLLTIAGKLQVVTSDCGSSDHPLNAEIQQLEQSVELQLAEIEQMFAQRDAE